VIVMFVGLWELGQITHSSGEALEPTEPGWQETYEADVLDPWIEFITQADAEVLWVGTPAVDNDDLNPSFAALNLAWRTAADRWDPVTFVDAGPTLGLPEDGFTTFVRNEEGRRVRARQVDGLHLCADGAALLATDVLAVITELWAVPLAPLWQDGTWKEDERAYPATSCP
jgi:hypothetical protein